MGTLRRLRSRGLSVSLLRTSDASVAVLSGSVGGVRRQSPKSVSRIDEKKNPMMCGGVGGGVERHPEVEPCGAGGDETFAGLIARSRVPI